MATVVSDGWGEDEVIVQQPTIVHNDDAPIRIPVSWEDEESDIETKEAPEDLSTIDVNALVQEIGVWFKNIREASLVDGTEVTVRDVQRLIRLVKELNIRQISLVEHDVITKQLELDAVHCFFRNAARDSKFFNKEFAALVAYVGSTGETIDINYVNKVLGVAEQKRARAAEVVKIRVSDADNDTAELIVQLSKIRMFVSPYLTKIAKIESAIKLLADRKRNLASVTGNKIVVLKEIGKILAAGYDFKLRLSFNDDDLDHINSQLRFEHAKFVARVQQLFLIESSDDERRRLMIKTDGRVSTFIRLVNAEKQATLSAIKLAALESRRVLTPNERQAHWDRFDQKAREYGRLIFNINLDDELIQISTDIAALADIQPHTEEIKLQMINLELLKASTITRLTQLQDIISLLMRAFPERRLNEREWKSTEINISTMGEITRMMEGRVISSDISSGELIQSHVCYVLKQVIREHRQFVQTVVGRDTLRKIEAEGILESNNAVAAKKGKPGSKADQKQKKEFTEKYGGGDYALAVSRLSSIVERLTRMELSKTNEEELILTLIQQILARIANPMDKLATSDEDEIQFGFDEKVDDTELLQKKVFAARRFALAEAIISFEVFHDRVVSASEKYPILGQFITQFKSGMLSQLSHDEIFDVLQEFQSLTWKTRYHNIFPESASAPLPEQQQLIDAVLSGDNLAKKSMILFRAAMGRGKTWAIPLLAKALAMAKIKEPSAAKYQLLIVTTLTQVRVEILRLLHSIAGSILPSYASISVEEGAIWISVAEKSKTSKVSIPFAFVSSPASALNFLRNSENTIVFWDEPTAGIEDNPEFLSLFRLMMSPEYMPHKLILSSGTLGQFTETPQFQNFLTRYPGGDVIDLVPTGPPVGHTLYDESLRQQSPIFGVTTVVELEHRLKLIAEDHNLQRLQSFYQLVTIVNRLVASGVDQLELNQLVNAQLRESFRTEKRIVQGSVMKIITMLLQIYVIPNGDAVVAQICGEQANPSTKEQIFINEAKAGVHIELPDRAAHICGVLTALSQSQKLVFVPGSKTRTDKINSAYSVAFDSAIKFIIQAVRKTRPAGYQFSDEIVVEEQESDDESEVESDGESETKSVAESVVESIIESVQSAESMTPVDEKMTAFKFFNGAINTRDIMTALEFRLNEYQEAMTRWQDNAARDSTTTIAGTNGKRRTRAHVAADKSLLVSAIVNDEDDPTGRKTKRRARERFNRMKNEHSAAIENAKAFRPSFKFPAELQIGSTAHHQLVGTAIEGDDGFNANMLFIQTTSSSNSHLGETVSELADRGLMLLALLGIGVLDFENTPSEYQHWTMSRAKKGEFRVVVADPKSAYGTDYPFSMGIFSSLPGDSVIARMSQDTRRQSRARVGRPDDRGAEPNPMIVHTLAEDMELVVSEFDLSAPSKVIDLLWRSVDKIIEPELYKDRATQPGWVSATHDQIVCSQAQVRGWLVRSAKSRMAKRIQRKYRQHKFMQWASDVMVRRIAEIKAEREAARLAATVKAPRKYKIGAAKK